MDASFTLTVACFLCAITFTVVAEMRKTTKGTRLVWCALVSLIGVCAGLVSMTLIYFLGLGALASFAISAPLGIVAFFALAWLKG